MGGACVGGALPARGHVQRGDAAGGESSRVEVISQTPAAANLDFINLVEVVDESAATAVLERLNALVALSAFLRGEGIGEPGRGGERDRAEDAHTAIAAAATVAGGATGGAGCGGSPPPATTLGRVVPRASQPRGLSQRAERHRFQLLVVVVQLGGAEGV